MKELTAVIEKDDDWFMAYCPELGTVSQGKTKKSALDNLKEATELYLEGKQGSFKKSMVSVERFSLNVHHCPQSC